MLQEIPGWAARLLLFILIGISVVAGLPVAAWIGKREVQRWESKVKGLKGEVQALEEEIDRMQEERRQEHRTVEQKLDTLLDEVEA